MLSRSHGLIAATLAIATVSAACAGRTATPAVAPSVVPQLPPPQADPVVDLNTTAEAAQQPAPVQGPGPAPAAEPKSEPAAVDELLAITRTYAPIATPQTTFTVSQDLRYTLHDIEIPLNAKVLSYVQLFSGRLKGYLEEGLSRGARFLPMIQSVFRAEGLPLDLAYIPLIESAFKPTALSRAKAKGIWQFMRGTGLENGLKTDWYIDERSDPEKATYAAARYLKTLHEMFDGDWHLALASYNGGPGRVKRAIKRSGRTDFWKLTATSRFLPRETRDYVPLILAAVIVARNPAQYGLNIPPPPMPGFEEVEVTAPVDLRLVAEWAGVPVETIQELNPELRRWTTPLRSEAYTLKVPEGTSEAVRSRLATAGPEELAYFTRHTVKKGETIATIARKLKVTRADLAEANYLSTRARLQAGQQLIVPRAPSLATVLAATRPDRTDAPVQAALTEPGQPDVVLARNVLSAAPAADAKLVHRVKRGETLSSIARRYGTTVTALKEWNRITGSAIRIGQRLTVITPRTVATN